MMVTMMINKADDDGGDGCDGDADNGGDDGGDGGGGGGGDGNDDDDDDDDYNSNHLEWIFYCPPKHMFTDVTETPSV